MKLFWLAFRGGCCYNLLKSEEVIFMKITVRRAIADDAPAIFQLNAAFDDVRATLAHIATHIETNAHFETPFVATINGHIVGFACLRLLPCVCDQTPYAELTELIVDPHYRRQGVGRSLVQYIERQAKTHGAATLTLMTAWHNADAHAFYHSLGYRLHTINMQRSLLDSN